MKLFILSSVILLLVRLGASFDLDAYRILLSKLEKDTVFRADFEKSIQHLLSIEPDYFDYTPFKSRNLTFDCDTELLKSQETPSSVHQLRPNDVKVIAAMGDSVTAALGANARTILGLLIEFRGRSWSEGGQDSLEKVVTLPNILKKFNPQLYGYSKKSDNSLLFRDGVGFNTAVSGQESHHIPRQARLLVERMRQSKEVNFELDWKIVTLFAGDNDLCRFCQDPDFYAPSNYVSNIRESLDYLQENLPRTFVNVVQVANITDVKEMNKGLVCSLIHRWIECACGAYPKDEDAARQLQTYISEYHRLTRDLVETGRYDSKEDFVVVLQPFTVNFMPPRFPDNSIDFSYWALDCFHFSPKGHALSAIGLWNNMLQRVGAKSTTVDVDAKISCPSKNQPYFFTKKNSV